jgi:hypothetical protein
MATKSPGATPRGPSHHLQWPCQSQVTFSGSYYHTSTPSLPQASILGVPLLLSGHGPDLLKPWQTFCCPGIRPESWLRLSKLCAVCLPPPMPPAQPQTTLSSPFSFLPSRVLPPASSAKLLGTSQHHLLPHFL